jgi:hypothetical protein
MIGINTLQRQQKKRALVTKALILRTKTLTMY